MGRSSFRFVGGVQLVRRWQLGFGRANLEEAGAEFPVWSVWGWETSAGDQISVRHPQKGTPFLGSRHTKTAMMVPDSQEVWLLYCPGESHQVPKESPGTDEREIS